jgi:hypothetical protein
MQRRGSHMVNLSGVSWTAAAFLLVTCSVRLATAAEPPADLCSLLPAALVSKTLRQTYGPPEKTVAPRPYANTAEGTDCTYPAKSDYLLFRAYVDPSPAESAELFARLKNFFGRGSTPVAGVGDEAYLDAHHGLHVRKGKVRFFISAKAANDKQLRDLASGVVGQL